MLLAIVLAATWSRISEMTGRFGTDPNGDAVYQHAARWSRIEALGQAGPPQLRNTLDMQLVLIPPGRFVMGSPSREEYRSSDEWPHRVEITERSTWEPAKSPWPSFAGSSRPPITGPKMSASRTHRLCTPQLLATQAVI